jgi:hypothetical protein
MRDAVIAILLIGGVGIELLCCVGVLVMRGAYARLHYGAPDWAQCCWRWQSRCARASR